MKTDAAVRVVGVIPARYASTRLPAKALVPLCGTPLVVRVLERTQKARRLDAVLVATDDARIADVVRAAGGVAVLTRPDHPSGTDRVAEAVAGQKADVVINIQGDEPLMDPELIDRLADTMVNDAGWDMATAATPILDPADLGKPSVVKVVWDRQGRALYFSRAPIPFVRDEAPAGLRHWRHLGIYAYQRAFLDRLVSSEPCVLERAEKLEQLRALHLGAAIKVLETADTGLGVDTPDDIPRAEQALRAAGLA